MGQQLAYMEIKHTLALLLLHFRVSLAEGQDPNPSPVHSSLTMMIANGLRVRLEKRGL